MEPIFVSPGRVATVYADKALLVTNGSVVSICGEKWILIVRNPLCRAPMQSARLVFLCIGGIIGIQSNGNPTARSRHKHALRLLGRSDIRTIIMASMAGGSLRRNIVQ